MRRRTLARELALQFLYQIDLSGKDAMEELDSFLKEWGRDLDTTTFARELVSCVWEHRSFIDDLIRQMAHNWTLNRMATVDRNILRLGIGELWFRSDIPPRVAINEAIEIAKKYSTKNSAPFVNGILDQIRQRKEKEIPMPAKVS